ncbi:hypothetical protein [Flagellimonas sp. CMM7]|uniref:hypothetical protein n=1 Tax=Flagellimonas sp. CMM7 TaxID=2654676 RepID=UPI0013CFD41F|nr:hypothetical protein [Flagellimonas sp. CMM7]UII78326.1 hypothetical protein LV704_11660 [Flagellimonas sp. CMM7]
MKKPEQLILFLFVTLFLSSKVAGLHVLTHDTDDVDVQHCELCDVTSSISFTPLLSTDNEFSSPGNTLFIESKHIKGTELVVFYKKLLENSSLSRPPPQIS